MRKIQPPLAASTDHHHDDLRTENAALRARLEVLEANLAAIRCAGADVLVDETHAGSRTPPRQGIDAAANRLRDEILAHVNDAVIALDEELRITYLNAPAEHLYETGFSDALGRKWSEIYQHPWLQPATEGGSLAAILKSGFWRGENLHIKTNGESILTEVTISRLTGTSGNGGFLAVIRDVTERRQSATALLESEEKLSAALEATGQGTWEIDLLDDSVSLSPWTHEIFGVTTGEAPHTREEWRKFVVPEDRNNVAARINAVIRDEGKYIAEFRIHRRNDGCMRWIRSEGYLKKDAAGRPWRLTGVLRDITESKLASQLIEESEARMRLFIEHAPAAIAMFNTDLCYLSASNRWKNDFQLSGDITGCHHYELFPEIPERWKEVHRRALAGETVSADEDWFERLDGGTQWLRWEVRPWFSGGEVGGILIAAEDVTPHVQAKQALLQSEAAERARRAEVEALMDAIPAAVFITHDPQCKTMTGNRSALELLRLKPGQNPSRSADEPERPNFETWADGRQLTPDELPMQRAAALGKPLLGAELDIVFPDGVRRHLMGSALPLFDDVGSVRGCVGVMSDITDLKRVELALRESQEMLQAVNEGTEDAIFVKDRDTRVLMCNPAMLRIVGKTAEEVLGFTNEEIFASAGISAALTENDLRIMESGRTEVVEETIETPLGPRVFLGTKSPRRDAQGNVIGLIGVSRDITLRKQAEAALRQNAELFAKIIEHAPGGVYVVDSDFRITQVNSEALPVFSSVDPLIGRDLNEVQEIIWGPELGAQCTAIFRHTLDTGERYVSPRFFEQRHDIGLKQAFEWETQRITLPDGRHGVVCYFTDITERLKAEDILRESERRFRQMIDALPAAVYTTDAEGYITHFNPASEEFTGRTPRIGEDRWCITRDLYRPDGSPMPPDECPMATALRDGRIIRGAEAIARRPDGSELWFTPYPTPLYDSNGNITGGINMMVDITRSKRRELNLAFLAEMQKSFAPLSTAAEIMRVASRRTAEHLGLSHCVIAEVDESGDLVTVLHDQHAQGHQMISGVFQVKDFLTKEERLLLKAGGTVVIGDVNTEPRPETMALEFHKLGIRSIVNTSHVADGRWKFVLSAMRDEPHDWTDEETELLTELAVRIHVRIERARAEQELLKSEQRFRLVLENSPITVSTLDANLRFTWIYNTRHGFTPENVIGKRPDELIPEEDASDLMRMLQEVLAKGETVRREVSGQTHGVPWHYLNKGEPMRGADGSIVGLTLAQIDITDHKLIEEALRESEARFRSTFHNATTPMAVKMPDGHYLEVNRAYCDMLGYSEQEVLDTTFIELTHPGDRQATGLAVGRLQSGEISEFRMEKRFIHKNGQTIWCDTSMSTVPDVDGSVAYFIAQAHDITASKTAQEALKHSEQYARSQWAEAEAILEAIPANIAILDETGTIIRVNRAWTSFATHNGGVVDGMAVGANYLEVCDRSRGDESTQAKRFASGIRSVIQGASERFFMEYPCHSPQLKRWFIGYVTASRSEGPARAVVAHVDISAQKRIEEQIRVFNQQLEVRVHERTSELGAAVIALKSEIARRQRLEREILDISEREQGRLGQDLHDGLGQELAGIAMLGEVLTNQLRSESHPAAKSAEDIANYTRKSIQSARRLAKGLYPVELSRYGLLFALEDLANQTSQRFGIACKLIQSGPTPRLGRSIEIHIYRIVQECIANAIRHGKASGIDIEARGDEQAFVFIVTDNGVGFEHPVDNPGMGLHLMQYRARVIGGEIEIGRPGYQGCRVICRLPVS